MKPPQTKPLTVGQVARRAGVGVETVRFYEREGLLEQPARRASGYRQYGADAVARLRFIRRAKELGFTLKEIGELLALRVEPGTSPADLKRRAKAKVADIDARIRDLNRTRDALLKLAQSCPGCGSLDGCPILDALVREEESRE
jgi:MerR family copper efflux transcriptional regulator